MFAQKPLGFFKKTENEEELPHDKDPKQKFKLTLGEA